MDRLNARLCDLLQERARLAVTIARWKQERGMSVPDTAREAEMLQRMLDGAGEGFDRAALERLLRGILHASRELALRATSRTAPTRASGGSKRSLPALAHHTASPRYRAIWRAVASIPRGKVATYGQIARVAGVGGQARLVGYALHAAPDGLELPWHRVINGHGRISLSDTQGMHELQRALLESEGIVFIAGRVDLKRFGWRR
jgi:methylated-DNA-protein-cysteine methyltransferase-like protein